MNKRKNKNGPWVLYHANLRTKTIVILSLAVILLLAIFISSLFIGYIPTSNDIYQLPSLEHIFGTDWMGRDMFQHELVAGIIDLFGSIPHILLIILLSICFGGGFYGVIMGVGLTHWTPLARVLRSEVKQIKTTEYIKLSQNLGKSKLWIAIKHIFPLVLTQIIVGVILMFPHAIMHEASITFLGFGLPPHEPAIGVILSESMNYLSSGYWWLAFFPGLSLLILVLLFDLIGDKLQKLINPETATQ